MPPTLQVSAWRSKSCSTPGSSHFRWQRWHSLHFPPFKLRRPHRAPELLNRATIRRIARKFHAFFWKIFMRRLCDALLAWVIPFLEADQCRLRSFRARLRRCPRDNVCSWHKADLKRVALRQETFGLDGVPAALGGGVPAIPLRTASLGEVKRRPRCTQPRSARPPVRSGSGRNGGVSISGDTRFVWGCQAPKRKKVGERLSSVRPAGRRPQKEPPLWEATRGNKTARLGTARTHYSVGNWTA